MDDDILTIEEVAKYLRVSERTVYDWAQKGEIPSGKIGTVWRFKKSEIERWVNDRLSSGRSTTPVSQINMHSVLAPERVIFLAGTRKHEALAALADNLATAVQVKSKNELLSEIVRREELMSTAIGRGIAIPHVRLSSVTDLVVSVGISKQPIQDFNAFDDELVQLLFMIAAAYNQHAYYLQTLSYFSTKLKSLDLRTGLLQAATPQAAYELLMAQDK
ncbi:MAG: PTS sugar transporter subunit IIA [Spirochaetes bacterium]|nr:PTS sugar transporter subunit IIA [Spirochaetota bacterium]